MNFNELSWAAFCFYYRSVGDTKYCKIMRDNEFLTKLRSEPWNLNQEEFEEKALLDYINIESYDLLIGHRLSEHILKKIIDMQEDVLFLQDLTLLDCDFTDGEIVKKIANIYAALHSTRGLWLTGVSKIAHLLNDKLLPIMNLDITCRFEFAEGSRGIIQWMKIAQIDAQEVVNDFKELGFTSSPEELLSQKLGYTSFGCHKSLVKFLDEYYWLCFGDNLPIPPRWNPDILAIHSKETGTLVSSA